MPIDQFQRFPIPEVAQHGKMSHATVVGNHPSLPLAQPDGDVAQWLAVLRLCLLVGHEHYFGALPIYTRLGLPVRLPFLFRNFQKGLAQRLAHPHADRKTNASLRPFCTSLVRQPAQQLLLMVRPNRPDSNRCSPFWAARRTLLLLPSREPSVPVHSHPETHPTAPRPSRPTPPASADSLAALRRCTVLLHGQVAARCPPIPVNGRLAPPRESLPRRAAISLRLGV